MNETRLAVVATLQARRIQKLQADLAAARERNKTLRSRVSKLQQSRDQWRKRATANRATINVLRTGVYQARRSRDMWRHRTMTRGDAII